jgi:hypothetical protein
LIRRLLAFAFLLNLLSGAACARITLNSQTTLLMDPREPGPIQAAVKNLQADLQEVFGGRIRVARQPAEAGPVTICVAFDYDVPKTVPRAAGWERLHIQAVSKPWPDSPARQAVVLTGSDVRGTIYAIYQFSYQFLRVDPLYWWTDHPPHRRPNVIFPSNFTETEAPVFHYRGFFINDEDLLTGWRPGISDGDDISLKTWDRIFEAILRLKGDMVIPGTWIFPYEPQIRAAAERGLIVTQHHVNVLGLDTYRWPHDKPYSFINAPNLLEAAWRRSISQYPRDGEMVWSVGYRGQNDYPFWLVDKNSPTTAAGRAHVIQEAINTEIEILKQQRPAAPMVMNAWAEAAPFIRAGLLKVPPGVTLVWPDNGHGTIQDRGELKAGEGVYYHAAMIDWRSSHFSELVPPKRIAGELGRAVRAGATEYLIVNTSNLRPVVMTSRATMELAWNPKPWIENSRAQASAYLRKWCGEEFGAGAASALVKYYEAYFAAPAKYGPAEDARMGDQFYQVMARRILLQLSKGTANEPLRGFGMPEFQNTTEFATRLAGACRAALPRWERTLQLAEASQKLVAKDRASFFRVSVLTQVEINLHGNRMLLDVAEAALTSSAAQRIRWVRSAIDECSRIEGLLHAADYGKWQGFYTRGDWLLDVPLTRLLERAYLGQLEGRGMPENAIVRAQDSGFAYHMITAYQGTQTVQF